MLQSFLVNTLVMLLTMTPGITISAQSSNPQIVVNNDKLLPTVQIVRACSQECEALDKRFIDERTILSQQADRQYSQLKDSLNLMIGCFSVLAAVALGLFYFIFGRSKKEVREFLDECLKKDIDKLIEKDLKPVHEKVSGLQKELELLLSVRERRVVWIALESDDIDGTQSAFNAVGLQRVDVQTPIDSAEVNIADCNLVVLSFDGSDLSKAILNNVVEQLLDRYPPVHLVIYTYGNGINNARLESDEFKMLAKLKWFSMANFPSTMLSQVVSLVRGSVSTVRR